MVRTSIEVRTSFKVHPVLQYKYALSGTDIKLNIMFSKHEKQF